MRVSCMEDQEGGGNILFDRNHRCATTTTTSRSLTDCKIANRQSARRREGRLQQLHGSGTELRGIAPTR